MFPHILLLKALQPLGYATAGVWKRERDLEEAHFHTCLLDTDLHCTGNYKFERTTAAFSMTTKPLNRSKDSGRMVAQTCTLYAQSCTHRPPHSPEQERGGERQRRQRAEGCESPTSDFSSFAFPHASFICITLPECETLHLFCKC